jgi:pyrroloquinoline quinone (PQQ) biosynthesis protein C
MPGTSFFLELEARISEHPALNHVFLEKLATETLSLAQLRAFAAEHYMYSRRFACNLAAVIANLPDEHARTLLVLNMYEEIGEPARLRDRAHLLLLEEGLVTGAQLGHALELHVTQSRGGDAVSVLIETGLVSREQVAGVMEHNTRKASELTHPALFRRFMRCLGLTAEALGQVVPLPETHAFNAAYDDICRNGHWLEGLGAMGPGTECIVPRVYSKILDGIRGSGLVTPADYVFWTVHVHCDDGHGRNVIDAMRPYVDDAHNRELISRGAIRALDARARWFDGLHRLVFGTSRSTDTTPREALAV